MGIDVVYLVKLADIREHKEDILKKAEDFNCKIRDSQVIEGFLMLESSHRYYGPYYDRGKPVCWRDLTKWISENYLLSQVNYTGDVIVDREGMWTVEAPSFLAWIEKLVLFYEKWGNRYYTFNEKYSEGAEKDAEHREESQTLIKDYYSMEKA